MQANEHMIHEKEYKANVFSSFKSVLFFAFYVMNKSIKF